MLWYANFFSIVVVSGLAMHALWPMVSLSLGWSIPSFYYIKVRHQNCPFLSCCGLLLLWGAVVEAAGCGDQLGRCAVNIKSTPRQSCFRKQRPPVLFFCDALKGGEGCVSTAAS